MASFGVFVCGVWVCVWGVVCVRHLRWTNHPCQQRAVMALLLLPSCVLSSYVSRVLLPRSTSLFKQEKNKTGITYTVQAEIVILEAKYRGA